MKILFRFLAVTGLLLACGVSAAPPAVSRAAPNAVHLERITQLSDGTLANYGSLTGRVTPGGRYVVFMSGASNLVAGDDNNAIGIFLYDRFQRTFERIAQATEDMEPLYCGAYPSISADGRYVSFDSKVAALAPNDANSNCDAYLQDRQTGVTVRISSNAAGQAANGLSAMTAVAEDGSSVAYMSEASDIVPGDTNAATDIFVYDRQTGGTKRISVSSAGEQGNGPASFPGISADGRYVAFQSAATNLVPDDTNGAADIFVHDRVSGATQRVSLTSDGTQLLDDALYPFFAASGRYVTFSSEADNLPQPGPQYHHRIYIRDLEAGVTELVSVAPDGTIPHWLSNASFSSVSADGRYVAFDADASSLIVLRDRVANTTEIVSRTDNGDVPDFGESADPYISSDGGFVVFESNAFDLIPGSPTRDEYFMDIYLSDRGLAESQPDLLLPKTAAGSEVDGRIRVEVRLSAPTAKTVQAAYASSAGSASADDYTAISGWLSFAPGETSKAIEIAVRTDATPEPDETFVLAFNPPEHADLAYADSRVTCIIRDEWPFKIHLPWVWGGE